MTGVACAFPMMIPAGGGGPGDPGGPFTATMTVASQAYSSEPFPGIIVWIYNDGYLGFGLGDLDPKVFSGADVVSLYWYSSNDHSTGGSTVLTVSGNRTAGFVTSVTCDGVDLGAIGAPSYNSGWDQTSFFIGSFPSNNPFGTSGTHAIVIT